MPSQSPRTSDSQVSHALQLALKLEDPRMLPRLLNDIEMARPHIRSALEGLSFLHFARFMPSWDGTALMVITEFDGPMKPYVMDFVVVMGDVFNMILGYVDPAAYKREWLPVQNHPDEFWAFVQEWNRVPFGPPNRMAPSLFPAGYDYPLYSAYPGKTVIDIAGPRTQLPLPVMDHPAAPVDRTDVQGNILEHYKVSKAAYLFLKVEDAEAARAWLAEGFVDKKSLWGGVQDAQVPQDKPAVVANVGFTHEGLGVLLPRRQRDLDLFPPEFRAGAETREHLNEGKGPHDDRSDRNHWLFGLDAHHIHVVVFLHGDDDLYTKSDGKPVYGKALNALLAAIEANAMSVVHTHLGAKRAQHKDYFGYRDGISQPRISGQSAPKKPDFQPAASPGEFLLGKGYASIYGGPSLDKLPADLAQNGTYGALRLMEQHVDVFDKVVADAAAEHFGDKKELAAGLVKARLMGRWPDGQPLSLCPEEPVGKPLRNDFDYAPSWEHPGVVNDHHGALCPVGAHIRRVNPRTARVAGERHTRRIIRRGLPTEWSDGGTDHKGLMGLFFCGSLERQFEFIQREWIQGDRATSGIAGTQDPIAGIRVADTTFQLAPGTFIKVPPLVRVWGSVYLFLPSISALLGLQTLALTGEGGGAPTVVAPTPPNARPAPRNAQAAAAGRAPAEVLNPIKPLDPLFVANPFPAYKQLRDRGDTVVWVPEHKAYWVLSRDDVETVLNDNVRFQQQAPSNAPRGLLDMDMPRHGVVRPLIKGIFDRVVSRIDGILKEELDAVIQRVDQLDQFDFMAEIGKAVPRRVYWQLFGPDAESLCNSLAEKTMRHFSQPQRAGIDDAKVYALSRQGLVGAVIGLLDRALKPGAGAAPPFAGTMVGEVAKLVSQDKTDKTLDRGEAVATLAQLALVHMSSQFLLGAATRQLLCTVSGTSAWAELAKKDRELNPQGESPFTLALGIALEEARRMDPAVTLIERYVVQDQTVGGVVIPAGSRVCANVGSANRDRVLGGDPETFIWDRKPPHPHLSFGGGIHRCVGVYMQDKIVKGALARLIPQYFDLRLCDETATPAWIDNIYFRSLLALSVTR